MKSRTIDNVKEEMIERYEEKSGKEISVTTGSDGEKYVCADFVNFALKELVFIEQELKKCLSLLEFDEVAKKLLEVKKDGSKKN